METEGVITMSIGSKIRDLRVAENLTMQEVAERIGTTKQTIYKYENGIITNIPSDKIAALARIFRVSPAVIMGWEISPSGARGDFRPAAPPRQVPVLGTIPCGEPREAVQLSGETAPAPGEITCDYVFRAVGDSMIGAGIHDGDLVYIREQPEVENGQIAAVQLVEDGEFTSTLKRFYRDGSRVVLQPANPAYMPIVLTGEELDDVRIVGLAVYVLSNLV